MIGNDVNVAEALAIPPQSHDGSDKHCPGNSAHGMAAKSGIRPENRAPPSRCKAISCRCRRDGVGQVSVVIPLGLQQIPAPSMPTIVNPSTLAGRIRASRRGALAGNK
jgi:hypothetical protein